MRVQLKGSVQTRVEGFHSIEDNRIKFLPFDLAEEIYQRGIDTFNQVVDTLGLLSRPEFPGNMYSRSHKYIRGPQ